MAAYQTFLECGKRGDPSCINNLGSMFESGTYGLGRDMDLAVHHYVLAARFGSGAAKGNLTRLGIELPAVDLVRPDARSGEPSPEAAQTLAMLAEELGAPDAKR